jgi:hypothetical protein
MAFQAQRNQVRIGVVVLVFVAMVNLQAVSRTRCGMASDAAPSVAEADALSQVLIVDGRVGRVPASPIQRALALLDECNRSALTVTEGTLQDCGRLSSHRLATVPAWNNDRLRRVVRGLGLLERGVTSAITEEIAVVTNIKRLPIDRGTALATVHEHGSIVTPPLVLREG